MADTTNIGGATNAFTPASIVWSLPDKTRMKVLPKLTDIEEVPFERVAIVELDHDVGDGDSFLAFLFAKTSDTQAGAQILVSTQPNEGFEILTSFYSFGLYGTLAAAYPADTFKFDKDIGIQVGGASDDTEFGPIADADLFRATPLRFLIIDDEIMGFGGADPVGESGYHLTRIVRGLFNTPIQDHKAGAVVMGGLTAACASAFSGTGTYYFKVVPINYLGNPMSGDTVTPIKFEVQDLSRAPLRPARLQAVRVGDNISLSWIPRVRGYGGAGNTSPEVSTDLTPPWFVGHFAYSVNDAPKRVVNEPYLDVTATGAATVQIWQRDNGLESNSITLVVPAEDGTYFTN